MKRVMARRLAVPTAAALVALLAAACASDDSDGGGGGGEGSSEIKIGIEQALSGPAAIFGIPSADGAKLAIKELNDAGGITVDGKKYTFKEVVLDDRSDPATSVANMRQLTEDEGVKFIFGPDISALAAQAVEISPAHKAIQFSGSGAIQASGVTSDDKHPLVFSSLASNDVMAQRTVDQMHEMGATSVGIMTEDNATAGPGIDPVVKLLEDEGTKVDVVLFPPNTTDFATYFAKFRSEGVDVLWYYYPQTNTKTILDLASTMDVGSKGVIFRNANPQVAITTKYSFPVASVDTYPSLGYPANDAVAKLAEAVTDFDPDLPKDTGSAVFLSYDYVKMLAAAMEEAGTVTDTEKIGETLKGMTYDGVEGKICYPDDSRNPDYGTGTTQILNGEATAKLVPGSCT